MSAQPVVSGQRQSPIDICTEEVVNERKKRSLTDDARPLKIDYSPLIGVSMNIENNGHGWKLNVPDEYARKCPLTGGTLGRDEYRLLQIHAHWGRTSTIGSEHTVNGKTYPAEVHLVHWNVTKYSSPTEAQNHSRDGIAVVGVFVELGEQPHPILSIINGLIPAILYKNDKKSFSNEHLDLNKLIPERHNPNYWFYLGSLTTPPFSESVLWIVMKKPIFASESQINEFRKLYEKERDNSANHHVEENFRDVQRLNDRPILDVDSI